jgi:tetratricopeptide (TPR) repeat protein
MPADIRRARALLEVGRWEQAQQELAGYLATVPQSVEGLCLLARCQQLAAQFELMLSTAEQAVAAAPDHEWPHRLRSIALGKLGRVGEAVAAGRRAVDLAPGTWQTHVILVDALLAEGSVPALRTAYRAARQARELAPEEPEVHNACGRLYQAISDPVAARRCYGEALRLDPQNSTARNNLAVVELRQGRATLAGERLRDVLAERPTEALYQRNAQATATIWATRVLELATLAWLAALVVALAVRPWPVRLAVCAAIVVGFLAMAAQRYQRLSPALRGMVRANQRSLGLAGIQLAAVLGIGLWWGAAGPGTLLLLPLLVSSLIVSFVSVALLRNRAYRAVARVVRRWRYRWAVVRPVERGVDP